MHFLEETKRWLGEIIEIALLFIALGVVFEILFGPEVLFFGEIVTNLTALIRSVGDGGLAGLMALGIIFYLFHRKKAVVQG